MFCKSAVDSRRGLFYKFDWIAHRNSRLSKKVEDRIWGSGEIWKVDVKDTTNIKSRPAPAKRIKQEPVESESDGDATEDEYQNADVKEEDEDEDENEGEDELPSLSREGSVDSDEYDSDLEPQTPSKTRKRKRGVKIHHPPKPHLLPGNALARSHILLLTPKP